MPNPLSPDERLSLLHQAGAPADIDDLDAWFAWANARYFGGVLPRPDTLAYSRAYRRRVGKFGYRMRSVHGTPMELAQTRMHISYVNKRHPTALVDTLVHEMIHMLQAVEAVRLRSEQPLDHQRIRRHLGQSVGHGDFFFGKMRELNERFPELDVQVSEVVKDMNQLLVDNDELTFVVATLSLRDAPEERPYHTAFWLPKSDARPGKALAEEFEARYPRFRVAELRHGTTTNQNARRFTRLKNDGNLPRTLSPRRPPLFRQEPVMTVLDSCRDVVDIPLGADIRLSPDTPMRHSQVLAELSRLGRAYGAEGLAETTWKIIRHHREWMSAHHLIPPEGRPEAAACLLPDDALNAIANGWRTVPAENVVEGPGLASLLAQKMSPRKYQQNRRAAFLFNTQLHRLYFILGPERFSSVGAFQELVAARLAVGSRTDDHEFEVLVRAIMGGLGLHPDTPRSDLIETEILRARLHYAPLLDAFPANERAHVKAFVRQCLMSGTDSDRFPLQGRPQHEKQPGSVPEPDF